jgi:glutaredoxin
MKHHAIACLLTATTLLGTSPLTLAQTVYRSVGPDGKVTFSDKPPASAEQGKVTGTGVGAAGSAANASGLPFELRQVVGKYPVTLYTAPQCAPCAAGRSMLTARGIPFSERTVTTSEDVAQFNKQMGDSSMPVLSVGGQRIKGYSDSEWGQYLDAAGYPKSSILPASFKNAAPSPLVAVQKPAEAPKAAEKPAPDLLPPPVPAANPANPAGIQF